MIDDLVEAFAWPLAVDQSPFAPQVLTQQERMAACRALIRRGSGLADESEILRRTVIRRVSTAARTDRVVQLRVSVVHRYESGTRDVQRANVWLELEDGRWKLATHEQLLRVSFMPAPVNLRQWRTYRRRLAREAATNRARVERRVASARELRAPVVSELFSCDGPVSQATDPPGDVEFASGGDLVPDQSVPTIDLLAASLHSRDGHYCWEVRFARPPGQSYELDLAVSRRSRARARPDVQPYEFGHEVTVAVTNGTALAGVDADEREWPAQNFVPVAVSQAGPIVRVSLARGDLFDRAGPFDGRHSFRWTIESFADNPNGVEDTAVWTDELRGAPHVP